MQSHNIWFKRWFNPTLRKLFKVEICSIISDDNVIGYGIRKINKNEFKKNSKGVQGNFKV
jgi:hypothetical protein